MTETGTILGIDPGTNVLGFGVIRIDTCGKPQYCDMGILDLRKIRDSYEKLHLIFTKVDSLCKTYFPDQMAIESPFYAKNAQVIFKLGRAQGSAIAAAVSNGVKVSEYAPRAAKMAICGNGAASKEQVAVMAERTLGISIDPGYLDATDALAIALCHYYQLTSPLSGLKSGMSWEKFVSQNPDRVKMN